MNKSKFILEREVLNSRQSRTQSQKVKKAEREATNASKTKSKRLLNRKRDGKKATLDSWDWGFSYLNLTNFDTFHHESKRQSTSARWLTKRLPNPPLPVQFSEPPLLTIMVDNLDEKYNCGADHPLSDIFNSKVGERIKLADRFSIEDIFKNVLQLQDDFKFKAIRMNSCNDNEVRPLQLTFEQEDDAKKVLKAYEKVYSNSSTVPDSKILPPVRFYTENNLILYLHNLKQMPNAPNAEERRKADRKKILKYFDKSLKEGGIAFRSTRICKTVEEIRPLKLTFETLADKQTVLNSWNS